MSFVNRFICIGKKSDGSYRYCAYTLKKNNTMCINKLEQVLIVNKARDNNERQVRQMKAAVWGFFTV